MARTRTALVALAVALVSLVGGAVLYQFSSGPSISEFTYLREPRFTHMNDQRVLIIDATEDPNVVGGHAFESLFQAYFKLEGVSRMSRPPAPRARWPQVADAPKKKWVGQYALPVPETVVAAPAVSGVTAGTWNYGDVAEILHVGPYGEEQPTIQRLLDFIASQGYRAVGEQEEEYVKGPGMILVGNPGDYLTIIRLRVEKVVVGK